MITIAYFNSSQLLTTHWQSYAEAFNTVFDKSFTVEHFQNKYTSNECGLSHHGFILDGDTVVGGCTAIPYSYNYFGQKLTFVLFVDAFLLPMYRKNEFALYDAYNEVKKELKNLKIAFLVSVPNDIAYPFWKKLARWRDIDTLAWYALPVRLGNVLHKSSVLNISLAGAWLWSLLHLLISYFLRRINSEPISLVQGSTFEKNRFDSQYTKILQTPFYYRIVDEDGVQTAYLLNAYPFSYSDVAIANWHIVNKAKVDIIIFVGKPTCQQLCLFKIPQSKLPRKLHFCGGEIAKGIVDDRIYDKANWNFGLVNFDTR